GGRGARGLVDPVGGGAAVDPAAAGGGGGVAQLRIGRQHLAVGVPAVDLGQHRLGARLVVHAAGRVVPGEVQHGTVSLVGRVPETLADATPEVIHEPQLRALVGDGLDRLVVPLHHPLGVGEGAVLLGVGGGGEEEHLGLELFG